MNSFICLQEKQKTAYSVEKFVLSGTDEISNLAALRHRSANEAEKARSRRKT